MVLTLGTQYSHLTTFPTQEVRGSAVGLRRCLCHVGGACAPGWGAPGRTMALNQVAFCSARRLQAPAAIATAVGILQSSAASTVAARYGCLASR